MNIKQIIAAFTVVTAMGSAFAADNGTFVEHVNVSSNKTRAEVRVAGSSEFAQHAQVASSRKREEVRSEAVQAARNLSLRRLYFGG